MATASTRILLVLRSNGDFARLCKVRDDNGGPQQGPPPASGPTGAHGSRCQLPRDMTRSKSDASVRHRVQHPAARSQTVVAHGDALASSDVTMNPTTSSAFASQMLSLLTQMRSAMFDLQQRFGPL